MEKRKTNYFKEIISGMDAFLAILIGMVIGVLNFAIDHFNVIDRLVKSDRWNTFAHSFCSYLIIAFVVVSLIAMLPVLFKKILTRRDFLLITVNSLSVVSFVIANHRGKVDEAAIRQWIIFLGVGVVFAIIRAIFVSKPTGDKLQPKSYFGVLARKYSVIVLTVIGMAIGIGLGYVFHTYSINGLITKIYSGWGDLSNSSRVAIVGSFALVSGLLLILGSFCNGGKSRVGFVDAIIYVLAVGSVFSVSKIAFEYPTINKKYLAVWGVVTGVLVLVLIVRSLFINPNVPTKKGKKSLRNYEGQTFERYSPVLIAMVGGICGVCGFFIDVNGLDHLFDSLFNAFCTAGFIVSLLMILTTGFVGLVSRRLRDDKTNMIDWSLFAALVAAAVLTLDLINGFTVLKIAIWAIALAAVIAFIIVRICLVAARQPVRDILLNSFVDVYTEEYAYLGEKVHVVHAEHEEVVEEEPAQQEEVVAPVVSEDDEVVEVIDENGKVILVRYKKSFRAKLSLGTDEVEDYYNEIKNYLLSYKTRARMSWSSESFNKGRIKCAKLTIRGKSLVMYIALDPKDYVDSKYSFRDVSDSKKYAEVPMMVKIKSNRGLKHAKELVDALMAKLELEKKEIIIENYREPHRSFDELLAMDLIRLANGGNGSFKGGSSVGTEVTDEEEPIVEEEPVVEEKVEEPEELAAPDQDIDFKEVVDENGKVILVRYNKSFRAKLSLSTDEVEDFYNQVKNYLLAYQTHARMSWSCESFNKGRAKCAKLTIRGKTLVMYIALDPKDYVDSKYSFRDVSDSKKYAEVPMMVKIKSNRGVKYAKELIDALMAKLGVEKKEIEEENFKEKHRSFKKLLEMGLIKEINGTIGSFPTKTPDGEAEEPEEDDDEEAEVTAAPEATEEASAEKAPFNSKRRSFEGKLKFTSDKTKHFYSELKNALQGYGAKSRLTKRNEIFRKSGLVAKLSISGKTIRLHIALNPEDPRFDVERYHQVSLAEKKSYAEVPMMVKVKSNLGLKRALELIDICCTERGLKLKAKYEPSDYAKDLIVDGKAIFERLGCLDKMADSATKEIKDGFNQENGPKVEDVMALLPVVNREPVAEDAKSENVYLDTVVKYIEGEEVSLASLRQVGKVDGDTQKIVVKIHDGLDRKLVVYCDEIDEAAALVVLATGGTVVLTK